MASEGKGTEAAGRRGGVIDRESRVGGADDTTRALRLTVAGVLLVVVCVLGLALSVKSRQPPVTSILEEAQASALSAQQVSTHARSSLKAWARAGGPQGACCVLPV